MLVWLIAWVSVVHVFMHNLVLFLIQSQKTFDKLPVWIDMIKENASSDVQLTLLGTKCDLRREDDDECVDYIEAKVS